MVSSFYANEPKLDTKYRVGLHTGGNLILGIKLVLTCITTRYKVSSWGTFVPQFDTWYQVTMHVSPNGDQLDTKYRVRAHMRTNSILGIELMPLRGPTLFSIPSIKLRPVGGKTRYQVSNCGTNVPQLHTWYRVDALTRANSIPSIELGYIYA